MNIPIVPASTPPYQKAYADVDAWRGKCVRHFAKLEQHVARFLAEQDPHSQAVGFGLGCRLHQLEAFLDQAPERSSSLREALAEFGPLKASRDAIVHGDGLIYLNINGGWLWDASFLKAREAVSASEVFREATASQYERCLRRRVQSLCDLLRNPKGA
jgi:hypothetical protein